ncbi:MAG: SagB/ThcOx family dehydrogenase [Candidatus Izemoplasmatales bacterium]|nr:SagB/ThcOx family dehydrogenase [Candidatus Izemoplasmatales bacterium]
MDDRIKRNRETIKPNWLDLYNVNSPKRQGLERPEQFLKPAEQSSIFKLLNEFPNIKQKSLSDVIASRRSLRQYDQIDLSFEELSYLLWESSRVVSYKDNAVFRTIPTAGATNSMETYIYVNRVEKLERGIYLYIQDKHQLTLIKSDKTLIDVVNKSLLKQLRGAQIVFFFTALPARAEYKYDFCAHKMIAIEAGHACQNLSLSAEVIDCGVCAICAYDQEKVDDLLGLDGEEHFTMYCATVGKKTK